MRALTARIQQRAGPGSGVLWVPEQLVREADTLFDWRIFFDHRPLSVRFSAGDDPPPTEPKT